MIAKLKGKIDTLGESWLIIDVQGVGYHVSCSRQTLRTLDGVGSGATLYVETVMRSEQMTLYGFITSQEQELFRLLTTVQGVGGRMGLALLSVADVGAVTQAVVAQDATFLTQADGVGPKLANRIVRELKDKIQSIGSITMASGSSSGSGKMPGASLQEASSALENLGYRRQECLGVLNTILQENPQISLEALIGEALKQLAPSGKGFGNG